MLAIVLAGRTTRLQITSADVLLIVIRQYRLWWGHSVAIVYKARDQPC